MRSSYVRSCVRSRRARPQRRPYWPSWRPLITITAWGGALLNQATVLGDGKVLNDVEELLGLEEERLVQGANYLIVEPATRQLENKGRGIRKRLVGHISALLHMYQRQAELAQQVLQEFEAKLQALPELEQGLGRMTRRLKVYQDIYS